MDNPWKFLNKIRFEPMKNESLFRAINLFLGQVQEMIGYAKSEKVIRMMLKKAVLELPTVLQYLYDKVRYRQINDVEQLIKEVAKQETVLSKTVTGHLKRQYLKEAKKRRDRHYKKHEANTDETDSSDA